MSSTHTHSLTCTYLSSMNLVWLIDDISSRCSLIKTRTELPSDQKSLRECSQINSLTTIRGAPNCCKGFCSGGHSLELTHMYHMFSSKHVIVQMAINACTCLSMFSICFIGESLVSFWSISYVLYVLKFCRYHMFYMFSMLTVCCVVRHSHLLIPHPF